MIVKIILFFEKIWRIMKRRILMKQIDDGDSLFPFVQFCKFFKSATNIIFWGLLRLIYTQNIETGFDLAFKKSICRSRAGHYPAILKYVLNWSIIQSNTNYQLNETTISHMWARPKCIKKGAYYGLKKKTIERIFL